MSEHKLKEAQRAIRTFLENVDEGSIICEPNEDLDDGDFNEILMDLEKVTYDA